MKKLTIYDIYAKFSRDGEEVMVSFGDIKCYGNPIDDEGDDCELVDDGVWVWDDVTASYITL